MKNSHFLTEIGPKTPQAQHIWHSRLVNGHNTKWSGDLGRGVEPPFSIGSYRDRYFSRQLHKAYTVGELSIRQAKICNFSRIGCETKKLWLSIGPVWRRPDELGWQQPQKGVNEISLDWVFIMRLWTDQHFFFSADRWGVLRWRAVDWLRLKMHFWAGQDVILKNYGARTSFHRRPLSMAS